MMSGAHETIMVLWYTEMLMGSLRQNMKYFSHHVESNQIWIVFIIFQLIWNQTEYDRVSNFEIKMEYNREIRG